MAKERGTTRRPVRFSRPPRHARLIASLVLLVVLAVLGRLYPTLFDGGGSRDGGSAGGDLAGRASVIDGDSLRLGAAEIRMRDIDAPEGPQTCTRGGREWDCGEQAREALRAMIGGQQVTCRSTERDKHGRYLAYCTAGGVDLNRAMVERGMALAFGGYREEERAARADRRGLWSGEFQRPQDWRRERGIGR